MANMDTSISMSYETRPTVSQAWVSRTATYGNTVETMNINHYPLDTSQDDGGPWFLTRIVDRPSFGYLNGKEPNNLLYHGPITCTFPAGYTLLSSVSSKTNSELDSFGTTAIARTAPTNPAFDMATALAELHRDGIPAMVGSSLFYRDATKLARSAGSEYLNVEFGWKPLLRDVQGFAASVKNSHQILESYRKGSDKKIRVSYDMNSGDETRSYSGTGVLSSPTYTSGQGTVSQTKRSRQWFAGAFRYHIPSSDTQVGKMKQWASMADHLLGVKVTPETLWNIAPWSWAADWFGTTGDVLANVSNLGRDGLVLQYGYSMAHSVIDSRITATYTARYGQSTSCSRHMVKEYKQRRPATPYGFGINLESLSAKQVAIIAALGLSRT